jgi:hypothetical protein
MSDTFVCRTCEQEIINNRDSPFDFSKPKSVAFKDEKALSRHIKRVHSIDIRSIMMDSHGHMFYCFCKKLENVVKDHKSLDSFDALKDHLRDEHNLLLKEY